MAGTTVVCGRRRLGRLPELLYHDPAFLQHDRSRRPTHSTLRTTPAMATTLSPTFTTR